MIISILYLLLDLIRLILLVYCIFSWLVRDPFNKVYVFLCRICDPVLNPIRKLLAKIPFLERCPIDLSPLVLGLVLSLIFP